MEGKHVILVLDSVAQFIEVLSCSLKDRGFNIRSGHKPRLGGFSPLLGHIRGSTNPYFSHTHVSLSPSPFLCLESMDISSGKDF